MSAFAEIPQNHLQNTLHLQKSWRKAWPDVEECVGKTLDDISTVASEHVLELYVPHDDNIRARMDEW